MLYNWEASSLGAEAVEAEVRKLMLSHGQVRTRGGEDGTTVERRSFTEADLARFEKGPMAEDIVFRFCFATTMERGRRLQAQGKHICCKIFNDYSECNFSYRQESRVRCASTSN